jgi:uncharacterized protein
MKKYFALAFCLSFFTFLALAQTSEDPDGFNTFYYPSGQKASEGFLKKGKPDGYWVSYFPTGIKKSEGNRKNFLLDSIWVFYNQLGDTTEKINYLLGKKNGFTVKYGYRNDRIGKDRLIILSRELYVNDKQEGLSYYYRKDGKLQEIVRFKDGKKNGPSFEYDEDSVIIAFKDYRRDYLVTSDRLNRKDSLGLKQGLWREYYSDGKMKSEAYYKDGLLSGIYKQFNQKGSLELALNYKNGVIDEKSSVLEKEVSIKNTYDSSNILVFSGAYIDSIPVGIHRYYNRKGEVIDSKVYSNSGILISQGIITPEGKREGKTRFFFEDGKIYSIGQYENNQRTGKWTYYYENGRIEQEGSFKNDLATGLWSWYFIDGKLNREEEFLAGKEDGSYTEYDISGDVLTKGAYVEGEKEGDWEYKVGDHSEVGKYVSGLRDGDWKYFYGDGKLQYEGNYVQGNPDGWIKIYYQSGQLLEEQYYLNGIRQKNWKKYDVAGNIILTIAYVDDVETRINGVKVENTERDIKLIK